MNTQKKRAKISKYTGKGGFGSTIVPMKLGAPKMEPFNPGMTRQNFKAWNGESLPASATPGYSRLASGMKAAPALAAAYAGALQIGKLFKGIKDYKKELTGETDSYTKSGELADKLRERYVAKRKK